MHPSTVMKEIPEYAFPKERKGTWLTNKKIGDICK